MTRAALVVIVLTLATQAGSRAAAPSATFIPAAKVSAGFEKGMPLFETDGYKIHASRREAPGMVEVHVRDTDIIYVLDGTATLVTGGDMVGGKTIATDEIRGTSIKGGDTQRLTKGDVFVIPNGVPHWFTELQAPFLYYVVKATSPDRGTR